MKKKSYEILTKLLFFFHLNFSVSAPTFPKENSSDKKVHNWIFHVESEKKKGDRNTVKWNGIIWMSSDVGHGHANYLKVKTEH